MDTSNKTNKPDPDPEPFDEATEKETYDWEKGKDEIAANNASLNNAKIDIEKEINVEENNDATNKSSGRQNQNISVESSMSHIFGTKEPGQTEINQEVQETLCLLLNINTIPEPILQQFKRAKWIKPSTIINIFVEV